MGTDSGNGFGDPELFYRRYSMFNSDGNGGNFTMERGDGSRIGFGYCQEYRVPGVKPRTWGRGGYD